MNCTTRLAGNEELIQHSQPEKSGKFCRLLISLANIFDPDQDRHHVCPDLDPNLFVKVNFENCQQTSKRVKNYPACKEIMYACHFRLTLYALFLQAKLTSEHFAHILKVIKHQMRHSQSTSLFLLVK